MKKMLLLLIMLMVNHFGLRAQSNEWIGIWRIDIDKSIQIMDDVSKQQYDTLSVEIKDRANSTMEGREFIFKDNNETTINWMARNTQKSSSGNWVINESNKLTITMEGTTAEYGYEFVTPAVLILKGRNRRGFFNNLYLKKIN